MAYTTYTAFVAALHALSVTDVTRAYAYPPNQINSNDLPIKYIRINTSGDELSTFDGTFGLSTGAAEIVILIEPTAQSNIATIYGQMTGMIDNLLAAIQTNSLALGVDRVSIEGSLEGVGDTDYWVVTATVEASG